MRTLIGISVIAIFCSIFIAAGSGCSSREETPSVQTDSTITYPSKKDGGVDATITLYRAKSKKSGKLLGRGQLFTIKEKAKVRALIELTNPFAHDGRDLSFHAVWIDPDGKEFYKKTVELTPSDSVNTIKSSISIPPGRREPGNYTFQVYLFRELIAEKKFELRAGDK